MPPFSPYVIPFTAAFAAGGILFVIGMMVYERRRARPRKVTSKDLELACPTCSRPLVVHRNDLTPLSAPEVALLVSALGKQPARRLGSYRCPYCESDHVFSLDGPRPVFVASDTFSPHGAGTYCADCHKPLVRPAWPPGALDGKISTAPEIQGKHGLVCSRCGAICCVDCVRNATRNRTKDGSYLCPRCFRGPVDRVHHW